MDDRQIQEEDEDSRVHLWHLRARFIGPGGHGCWQAGEGRPLLAISPFCTQIKPPEILILASEQTRGVGSHGLLAQLTFRLQPASILLRWRLMHLCFLQERTPTRQSLFRSSSEISLWREQELQDAETHTHTERKIPFLQNGHNPHPHLKGGKIYRARIMYLTWMHAGLLRRDCRREYFQFLLLVQHIVLSFLQI